MQKQSKYSLKKRGFAIVSTHPNKVLATANAAGRQARGEGDAFTVHPMACGDWAVCKPKEA